MPGRIDPDGSAGTCITSHPGDVRQIDAPIIVKGRRMLQTSTDPRARVVPAIALIVTIPCPGRVPRAAEEFRI
jgi:hypothetical protein